MAPVAGMHYLTAPVIAFTVIAGLALFLRWAFRGEPRRIVGGGRTRPLRTRRSGAHGRVCGPT